MNIFSLLDSQTVFPALHAKDKAEILDKLISSLQNNVSNGEVEKIREAVMERENIMSTGVGKGLAIPHGKAPGIQETYAAFAMLDEPVDYESIDDEPVNMVFLLVGPQSSNSLHIKLLSRISRLMNNSSFREQLRGCSSADEIIDLFKEQEHVSFHG
ncbi:PTS system, fructose-specific IIA component [Fodinibius salinus]|uniref:PTS system, fructose-specific IIA component n=1 Tax=Fodinibius salinus TaxID=860790 RepID=A0A5D3YL74_9BACT|nr:PTS sugar transporter subunit IIA [Fodinibius salinus]TYP94936.1 PTS system, fructose-specific IIA component [Fodinibius salinus]